MANFGIIFANFSALMHYATEISFIMKNLNSFGLHYQHYLPYRSG